MASRTSIGGRTRLLRNEGNVQGESDGVRLVSHRRWALKRTPEMSVMAFFFKSVARRDRMSPLEKGWGHVTMRYIVTFQLCCLSCASHRISVDLHTSAIP